MGGLKLILSNFLKAKLLKSLKKRKNVALLCLAVLFLTSGVLFYEKVILSQIRATEYQNAIQENLFQNNPQSLQAFFVRDIANGVNDMYTKSVAHFLVRRYFNNGGNIYEVFNYVDSHKELAFLKEAETIYPEMFEFVKNKRLPFTYSDQGMYASLAYFEILERNNYADISTLGTVANQYAKMAYYKELILDNQSKGKDLDYPKYSKSQVQNDTNKAILFIKKSQGTITKIVEEKLTAKDIPSFNILIGAVEYASALRYFQALNVDFSSVISSEKVFVFAVSYSYHFLPEAYLSTSLTNAATLLLIESTNSNQLRSAIYPFLDLSSKVNKKTGSILDKVLKAKFKESVSRFEDLNIYSTINIVKIANIVPEFKAWLMLNGWVEADFK